MFETTSFVDQALAGAILDVDETVDDAIEEWHGRKGVGRGGKAVSLADWLGMTHAEYALFLERPDALEPILMARRYRMSVSELLQANQDGAVKLAARGTTSEQLGKLVAWLKETGRL